MASEKLRAVFEAVDNISQTLEKIDSSFENLGSSVEGLSNDLEDNTLSSQGLKQAQERLADAADDADRSFDGLTRAMSEYGMGAQAANVASEQVGSTIDELESEVDQARRSFESLAVVQGMSTAQAATNAGAMKIAGNMIDDMGDEALKSAGQMGVLNTVMEELSLSGSALSVNIGAFNVSLRNLAPLIPIAASMGSVVTVMGALISSLGAATVAFAGFTAGGAIGFLDEIESQFEGVNNQAEALQALMGGIGDLFKEALAPLQSAENTDFFINLVEGTADFVNRLAQAIDQMRDNFMPLFTGFADIISGEFDSVANGFQDMMEMMNPVLLGLFEWFMQKLPDAFRFMSRITQDLAGPVGNLGNSILDLLTSIIETATAIFQGLAPALSVALDIATSVVDVFNKLSNGALQAALFIGSLVFAANKFVGIADTVANVGISAANTMSQWAGSIRNAGGVIPRMNDALANQFQHLRALGSVLMGNMSVQQASGQVQKDFKEEVQDFAEALLEAEHGTEKLRNKLAELQMAMQTGGVEGGQEKLEELQDEIEETSDTVDSEMDNISESASAGMEGVGDATGEAAESVSENMDNISDSAESMSDAPQVDLGMDTVQEKIDDTEDEVETMGLGEFLNGIDSESDDAAESVSENMDKIGDSAESMSDAPQVDIGMDTVQERLKGSGEQIDDVSDSADELGEKLGPEIAESMSASSGSIADAEDTISDSMDSVDGSLQSSLGSFENFDNEVGQFRDDAGGFSNRADEMMSVDNSLLRVSDSADEMGSSFAGSVDDLDKAQAQLLAFGEIDGPQASFADFGGEAIEEVGESAENSGRKIGVVTEALEEGALSAGPSEPLITPESGEMLEEAGETIQDIELTSLNDDASRTQGTFADFGSELGTVQTDLDGFGDSTDDVADSIQTTQKKLGAFEPPSLDEEFLAMADSADEIDLSGTMEPIDTTNLDKVKGKLGSVKDRAQAFGQRTSDAMRSAGEGITGFAVGAGDEIDGAAGSIRDGLDVIGGAAKEQAAVMKSSFIQAGGVTGILSSAVTKAKARLSALKTAAFNAAGTLKLMAQSAWQSITALAAQGAQAAKTALRNWYLAFSQGGVVAGFKAMAASAWGAVTGLVAAGASAIATAASFVAGLIPATLSAGLALNTAFAGIPAILGALVALSAAAVGILGNMDGISSGLKGTFNGLKSAISQIGSALLSVGVPAWNLFIDILEAALSPFIALWDGIKLIAGAFGLAGDEGGGLMGILGGLMDGFSALMNIIGRMMDFIAPAFSFIGDLIYSAIIIPFQILAGAITTTMQILQGLVSLAIKKIPFLSEIVGGLQSAFEMVKNAIAEIPAFMDTVASMIGGTIDAIVGGIQDALQPAVDFINGLIDQANKLPKTDIDKVEFGDLGGGASDALAGAQTTSAEVRENVRRGEQEPGDDVATQPDVNMSLEDSVENNVEVQADPEDQAQLSRITKDALEEANSFARRQQGGQ